jgi:hypothetical protein
MDPKQIWLPATVFLCISIPVALLLQWLDFGGDYKLILAILAGGVPVQFLYARMARDQQKKDNEQRRR